MSVDHITRFRSNRRPTTVTALVVAAVFASFASGTLLGAEALIVAPDMLRPLLAGNAAPAYDSAGVAAIIRHDAPPRF